MRSTPSSVLRILVVFSLPFLLGLQVHRQGFNFLDDGLWLLGTRVIAAGGTLYGDIFSIYGPARYFLLAPFFMILGQSVLTLAIFKALTDGTAAVFGFWYARRLAAGRWAWLVPLGVVAVGPVYPRYLAAAIFAALVGEFLARPAGRGRPVVLGLAWGGLCLFGLDMAGYGMVILWGGWFFSRWIIRGRGQLLTLSLARIATGLAAVLVVAALLALAGGVFGPAFWDTVVYPVTRFSDDMGVSWYQSFLRDPLLRDPFAGHFTGEILAPGWPGHAWQRVWSLRSLFILAWLVPLAFVPLARRSADPRLGPAALLAMAGWVTLLARGDIMHLRLVWFGILLLVPVLLARLPGDRFFRGTLGGLFILITLAPLFGEQVWLAVNLDRPGLALWERESAQVYLESKRVEVLQTMCEELPWDGRSAVLVWPAQPGMQFVLGAPLATSQATLLGGEVHEVEKILNELAGSRPEVLVLGSARGLVEGVTNFRGLEPTLWAHLRREYALAKEYVTGGETYLVALRSPAAQDLGPEVDKRLPGASQEMATSASPALGPGVSVGQAFRVEDFDLGAVELLFRSTGPYPYPISFILNFHEIDRQGGTRQIQQIPIQIPLQKRTQKVFFSFPPLPGTVGKTLLMEIASDPQGTKPFSLLWNKATPEMPHYVEYYPEGQAYLNYQRLEADLFFATY